MLVVTAMVLMHFSTHAGESDRTVWQSGHNYVALTASDAHGSTSNEHPVELGPGLILQLLSSIRQDEEGIMDVDWFGDDEDELADRSESLSGEALFTQDELRRLSPQLSRALSMAKPQQDVVFSISGIHAGMFGKSTLTTTGRIFMQQGQLNIIFGEVYVDIRKRFRRSGRYTDVPELIDDRDLGSFRLPVGERSRESDLPVALLPTTVISLHADGGAKREDWIRIDVRRHLARVEESRKREQRREQALENSATLQHQTQSIDQEQEQLKQKVQRLEQMMESQSVTTDKATAVHPPASEQSVEERLSELKSLHDKGYIDEAMYREKMRSILNDL